MNDYISREDILRKFIEGDGNDVFTEGYNFAVQEHREKVKNMPAADVQPIRHGRWIPQGNDFWLCSNCKENIIFSMHECDRTEKQRYCCKCGARMDGGIDG